MGGETERPATARGFFASRWHGAVTIDRLFWVDLALVGTLINVVAAFAAILLFGFKLPAWIAVAAFVAPLPYNVFLVLTVWRTTESLTGGAGSAYRAGALLWLALAFFL